MRKWAQLGSDTGRIKAASRGRQQRAEEKRTERDVEAERALLRAPRAGTLQFARVLTPGESGVWISAQQVDLIIWTTACAHFIYKDGPHDTPACQRVGKARFSERICCRSNSFFMNTKGWTLLKDVHKLFIREAYDALEVMSDQKLRVV
ncbi:hypothetical protein J0S82_004742 [Galemys pyrenaicus]|uniref:Uncharacterized protein n=1 Tax=Galemys pyrenaicus TaxID=202257 RepID=A0A8J6AI19_GALPY|nr:hypothetical protein J0S82_004742 [Galemys pyrenaicus]